MKLLHAALVGALLATVPPAWAAGVEVSFQDPDKFADASAADLAELKRWLERAAGEQIPAGTTLAIVITNFDRAGAFEPWRGAELGRTRVMRSAYPPRCELRFRLSDASGTVLRQAERSLHYADFTAPVDAPPGDAMRYDKALLSDWLRAEFPRSAEPKR